jgi:protein-disulfide isomerase
MKVNHFLITKILSTLLIIIAVLSAYKFIYLKNNIDFNIIKKEVNLDDAKLVYGLRKYERKIIVFSDYTCIYCKNMSTKILDIIIDSNKKIALYLYHFPLNKIGYNVSLAAECANDQKPFYGIHKKIFSYQDSIIKNSLFLQQRNQLELDDFGKYRECLANNKKRKIIEAHIAKGEEINIFGVPRFIIKDKLYAGDISKKELKHIILEN